MTDEQINAAVHVALGNDLGCPRCSDPECAYNSVPDYCNDLNAMHKAETALTVEQKENDYQILLETVTRHGRSGLTFGLAAYLFCHATARQRAEAFLRTLGKWEDSK
jgi:hypothetical protein